jgi:hypothetical protein
MPNLFGKALVLHTNPQKSLTAPICLTGSCSEILEGGHKNCYFPKLSGEPHETMKIMIPSKQEQLGDVI